MPKKKNGFKLSPTERAFVALVETRKRDEQRAAHMRAEDEYALIFGEHGHAKPNVYTINVQDGTVSWDDPPTQ